MSNDIRDVMYSNQPTSNTLNYRYYSNRGIFTTCVLCLTIGLWPLWLIAYAIVYGDVWSREWNSVWRLIGW
jgi:hypothetical protein